MSLFSWLFMPADPYQKPQLSQVGQALYNILTDSGASDNDWEFTGQSEKLRHKRTGVIVSAEDFVDDYVGHKQIVEVNDMTLPREDARHIAPIMVGIWRRKLAAHHNAKERELVEQLTK